MVRNEIWPTVGSPSSSISALFVPDSNDENNVVPKSLPLFSLGDNNILPSHPCNLIALVTSVVSDEALPFQVYAPSVILLNPIPSPSDSNHTFPDSTNEGKKMKFL